MKAIILSFAAAVSAIPAFSQLAVVSGSGQVVFEQSRSTQPLVVRATNAGGAPVADVPITWTITTAGGTLILPQERTNAQGLAQTEFLATSIQPGTSYAQATVTASSPSGVATFPITTVARRTSSGSTSSGILAQLITEGAVRGPAGTIVPGGIALQVVAAGGVELGRGIPNVGVRLVLPEGVDPQTAPSATCTASGGMVFTNEQGIARCDVQLGPVSGSGQVTAMVGDFVTTRFIALDVAPGTACNLTLTPSTQTVGGAGGVGSFSVTAAQGCAWTATSTASWITINSGSSGSGNGTVGFTAASNPGAQRTGVINVGNAAFSLVQGAAGSSGQLVFTTAPTLPGATTGLAYSIGLNVAGGQAPITWGASGQLPPGLSLNPSNGLLSGIPSTAGSYSFTVTATDSRAASVSQTFTLQVTTSTGGGTGGPLIFTTSSFPNAAVAQSYSAPVLIAGGCQNPFAGGPVVTLVSGSLPPGLTVQSLSTGGYGVVGTPTVAGTYSFALRAADSCGASVVREFSILVSSVAATQLMSSTPTALSFNFMPGSAVPAEQTVSIATQASSIAFTATTAGADWLSVTPSTGTTPAALIARVNPQNLQQGVYSAAITVVSQASNSPFNIPVTLTVGTAAAITVSPASLSFDVTPATPTGQRTLSVTSTPAGVSFNAVATTTSGGAWLSVAPTSGIAPAQLIVGVNAAGVPAGTHVGTISISSPGSGAPAQTVQVTFNVGSTSGPTLAPLALFFDFHGGGAVPPAQTLTVGSTGAPFSFIVEARTASGGSWLSVTPTQGSTPGTLSVSINPAGLPQGRYSGAVVITPDSTRIPLSASVTLNVTHSGPQVSAITNGASFAQGPIAPGEIVTIFGSNLGPPSLTTLRLTPDGRIDTTLAGVRVWFHDLPAAILHASATQVTAVVPYGVSGRSQVAFSVEYNGARSFEQLLPVVDSAPGIFTAGGSGQGAIVNANGTVNGPQNPAPAGSIVSIYATGEGLMNPAGIEGGIAPADPLTTPVLPVSVRIGQQEARVLYAGSAPGQPFGLIQINAVVPEGTLGNAPITVAFGSRISQSGVTISVRP
jgi:uncharacterized protein (TIGR03437 family)